jgi:hypothetical protein
MTAEKQTWRRPELVVLVRSRPEEAVLTACKGNAGVNTPDSPNCGKPGKRADCTVIANS